VREKGSGITGTVGGATGATAGQLAQAGQGAHVAGATLGGTVEQPASRMRNKRAATWIFRMGFARVRNLLRSIPAAMPKTPPESLPLERLIARAEDVLARFEASLPPVQQQPEWQSAVAFRWRKRDGRGWLQAVRHPHPIRLSDLENIDDQKERITANTRQFVAGRTANNVLLTGTRGSGKSSLVKAVLNEYSGKGLRLIEVDKEDLIDLADIVDLVDGRPEKFIIFCDDLSFEAGETAYKALKSVLDGSIAAPPDNVLIYATSNRRHMMPEYFAENLETHRVDDEIHPGETTEEKISLSERFGLWISFYPFSQDDYLAIAYHWARQLGVAEDVIAASEREALNWALSRGSRSGRVAWQFARDLAGRQNMKITRKKNK
jgi:predicted AAA+ superfamily ATPase